MGSASVDREVIWELGRGKDVADDLILLLGTHKGAFLLKSSARRDSWKLEGPFLKGYPVEYVVADQRQGTRLYASHTNPFYGPSLSVSKDLGQTWESTETSPRFDEQRGHKVERIWIIEPGRKEEAGVLYAGVDPGALFVSQDQGQHWEEVQGLTDHPTRQQWFPGAGGMCLHSIVLDHGNAQRMWVAISAAGVFYTEDGGQSWVPRNQGIRAEFLPNQYPEVGQCAHKIMAHPNQPDRLYLQNHGGVYRTDDGGQQWKAIEEGLPAVFGFPVLVHPHKPETIFVIPLVSAEERYVPNGKLGVYRSQDAGNTWERTDQGLPQKDSWLNVFRQSFTADPLNPCALYFGTSTGQVFMSQNDGDTWTQLADYLPPILSVRVCVV